MLNIIIDSNTKNRVLIKELLKPTLKELAIDDYVISTTPHPKSPKDVVVFLQTNNIVEKRGKSVWIDGVRYIMTHSLEAIIDNPKLYNGFTRDLLVPYKYPVSQPKDDDITITYGLPPLSHKGLCAFDIETNGLRPYISQVILMAFATSPTQVYLYRPDNINIGALKQLFESRDIQWVAQNGKFDLGFMLANYGLTITQTHDTMLMHYLLDERRGTHGLKEQCMERLGLPDYEQELKSALPKKKSTYDKVPPAILDRYAAKDAAYTYRLHNHLSLEMADNPHLHTQYRRLIDLSNALVDVESNGCLIDKVALADVEKKLSDGIDSSLTTLRQLVGDGKFNPRSWQQVGKVLYDVKGYRVPKSARKKNPRTTDSNTLKKLLAQYPDDTFLSTLMEFRQMDKLLSTYVLGIKEKIDPDGKLRTNFLIHGTQTGRLSSRPNLQNIPRPKKNAYSRPIRTMFTVPPGYVLLGADYAQAELRALAILSGEQTMIDAFNNKVDLHTNTARNMFKVDTPTSEQRTAAKTLNFASAYGISANTLASDLNITVEAAQHLLDLFFDSKPQLRDYLRRTQQIASQTGKIVARTGQIRRFELITDANERRIHNQATNYESQHLAAMCCNLALIWMNKWCKRTGLAQVLLNVHDALYLMCKIEDKNRVGKQVVACMERAGKQIMQTDVVIMSADVHDAGNWGDL